MWILELLAFALALLTFVGITESGGHWRRRTYAPPPCTPRACQVSSWSKWSHCTQQCGTGGIQSRWRKKTIVESCGGSCSNVLSETRSCNTDNCHNSGTPTFHGCSCRQGYRGTCCEIGKLKRYISLTFVKHTENLFYKYTVRIMNVPVTKKRFECIAFVTMSCFIYHERDVLWNWRKKVSTKKFSASRS